MNIKTELTRLLTDNGAGLIGVCSLDRLPGIKREFITGISIAVALEPEVIAGIKNGPTLDYHKECKSANIRLNELSKTASERLLAKGFKAVFWKATDYKIDKKHLSTDLPHKTLATMSGLGWIGKCALLVTKEFGSAVRLTSVLTDAPIEADNKQVEISYCGDCMECVRRCPGKAPSGLNWSAGLFRDEFFNTFECRKAARKLAKEMINVDELLCGICISVCPYTQKYVKEKK